MSDDPKRPMSRGLKLLLTPALILQPLLNEARQPAKGRARHPEEGDPTKTGMFSEEGLTLFERASLERAAELDRAHGNDLDAARAAFVTEHGCTPREYLQRRKDPAK